ncbi:hypothetical protein WNY37_13555 [Henriciella sp. AS95]|uniref:hypothetical protein n=1 Tax=Henriciella sp. AS95 TaxID=3135782 RepID=UPI003174002D
MKLSLKTTCAVAALAALVMGAQAQDATSVDFGTDDSLWSLDGECDDPRFEGAGMAEDPLDEVDRLSDATDCEEAYRAGTITLVSETGPATASSKPLLNAMPSRRPSASTGIDYGDDESLFALDGECDDARFIGDALAAPPLLPADVNHDASDCKAGVEAGTLRLRGPGDPPLEEALDDGELSEEDLELLAELAALLEDEEFGKVDLDALGPPPEDGVMFNGVNFGDDTSEWSNDGECDDPRFEGAGQTDTVLLEADAYHDATDCLAAWKEGGLSLKQK